MKKKTIQKMHSGGTKNIFGHANSIRKLEQNADVKPVFTQ